VPARRRRLGGADIHAAIDERGIHADDVAGQRLAQFDGEIRLAEAVGPIRKIAVGKSAT
jgi:hypothetical protein